VCHALQKRAEIPKSTLFTKQFQRDGKFSKTRKKPHVKERKQQKKAFY